MAITLYDCGPQLNIEDIRKAVGNFPNSRYFYDFYLKNNGGSLPEMFVTDREKISAVKVNQTYSISDFYKLKSDDENDNYLMKNNLNLRKTIYPCIDKIYPEAFPFAREMGDNEFWLNKSDGYVLYFPFDYGDDFCREITVVAGSFEEFINSLVSLDDFED